MHASTAYGNNYVVVGPRRAYGLRVRTRSDPSEVLQLIIGHAAAGQGHCDVVIGRSIWKRSILPADDHQSTVIEIVKAVVVQKT